MRSSSEATCFPFASWVLRVCLKQNRSKTEPRTRTRTHLSYGGLLVSGSDQNQVTVSYGDWTWR